MEQTWKNLGDTELESLKAGRISVGTESDECKQFASYVSGTGNGLIDVEPKCLNPCRLL